MKIDRNNQINKTISRKTQTCRFFAMASMKITSIHFSRLCVNKTRTSGIIDASMQQHAKTKLKATTTTAKTETTKQQKKEPKLTCDA